jgi:hypothetical protein
MKTKPRSKPPRFAIRSIPALTRSPDHGSPASMNDPTSPATHTGWAQFRHRGKFVRWYQTGPARFQKDDKGRAIACVWEQSSPRAHSGYVWYLPIGEIPPDPPPDEDDPKRPSPPLGGAKEETNKES